MSAHLLPALRPIAFSLLAGFSALAAAQTPPDAGSLHRDIERKLQAPLPATRLEPGSSKPMAPDSKARRVTVRSLQIQGATLIPPAELAAQVADLIGQSLSFAELENLAQRIAADYRQRGWYVRVYLPQQDVTDGTIRLQVLEGRYEGSKLENKGQRADGEYVQALVTHHLQPGEALSAAALERGLLLANELPGISANGLLTAGEQTGGTRLVLQVDDTPFITSDLALNNHGHKATGEWQALGGISFNNLSGHGDQLRLRALAAENIGALALYHALPLGQDGWRLNTHLSALDYQLGDRYKSLDLKGRAYTGGIDLTYPLILQERHKLKLAFGYEQRRYEDDFLGAAFSRHQVDALNLGLQGERRDSLFGGSLNHAHLQLSFGHLQLRDIANALAADAAGPRTAGDYSKLEFQLQRLQALASSRWQILAALSGQWSNDNLGSSERFSLGGPTRVRAYPVNEARGDQGLLLKLELQRELGHGWQAIAFYDAGRIRQHTHTWNGWQGGGNQPNAYNLSGAGLGLNWRSAGWQLAASAAAPIDSHPGTDANGRNDDGSKASALRYWLSLSHTF